MAADVSRQIEEFSDDESDINDSLMKTEESLIASEAFRSATCSCCALAMLAT